MHILGNPTKTVYLSAEPNKTYLEFEAAVAVKKGQPVKLTADGGITPWAPLDTMANLLGYVYTSDAAAGELVTVITRGFAMIYGITAAALDAGGVDFSTFDAVTDVNGLTGYNKYAAGTANSNAWLLDQTGAANVLARILFKN